MGLVDPNGAGLALGDPIIATYSIETETPVEYRGILEQVSYSDRGFQFSMREDHTEHLRTFGEGRVFYDWNPDPRGLYNQERRSSSNGN